MPSNLSHTEKDLLLLASENDQAAFTELFNHTKYKLFGFIHRLTGSVQITEDIVQEIFLRLWKDRARLAEVKNFNAYLFRMARNEAVDAFRRMARENIALQKLMTISAENVSEQTHPAEQKELRQEIVKALHSLPKQQQLVYRLSRESGLKYEEIARRLNITPGTVKNHMIHALHTLREHLQSHYSIIVIGVCLLVLLSF